MKKDNGKKKGETLLKVLPLCVTGLLVFFCWFYLRDFSFQDIIHFTPDNLFLAAAVIIGIYAVKSISIVFPLTAIFISTGVMFPLPAAILVNTIGLWVCITIPYFIGHFSGRDFVERLTDRYPKIKKLEQLGTSNELMTSYILRAIAAVPGDVISMLLGATGIRYPVYVLGSMLGLLPLAILQTLLGDYLDQPLSPQFIVLFVIMLAVSLASTLLFNRMSKKKKQTAAVPADDNLPRE